jgi:hypothetical protein
VLLRAVAAARANLPSAADPTRPGLQVKPDADRRGAITGHGISMVYWRKKRGAFLGVRFYSAVLAYAVAVAGNA